jgi:magnesium-transporting ATPase (P-type)
MLTGDQRWTAEAIARRLGLSEVFSRVTPEEKLRIVAGYQRQGEIVAMLGDGVNDAPALKKADIGVAMGRGADVAKATAGLVLQDDRFGTIAAAVEEGRVIFDNLRKFVFYLFSCNLGEIFVFLGAGLAGWPAPLLPLQILWLNIVTDTFPALALAFEPAEPDLMRRPPRSPRAAILSAGMVRSTAGYAMLIALCTRGGVVGDAGGPRDPRVCHDTAFMTLAVAQIFHLGNAQPGTGRAAGADRGKRLCARRRRARAYSPGERGALAPLAGMLSTVLGGREWLIVGGLV